MDTKIPSILNAFRAEILREWIQEQLSPGFMRSKLIKEGELRSQCEEFLGLLIKATGQGNVTNISAPEFEPIKEILSRISMSRSEQGFAPSETAVFIFSLKKPLFSRLRRELQADHAVMFQEIWIATELLDNLGLFTTEVYQRSREDLIRRQQDEMLELSTPVVQLWDGVLALPLIGTLDSNRTQIVMESLLQRIVETNSSVAIIDITGVPTVDTLVAQHLMKTVSAARLMGVDCIISGIRPQIAQTIVHLGVALGDVTTKGSLADAFKLALTKQRMGIVSQAQLRNA
jgi:rsbT co-antagonist protein RsbR